MALHPFTSEGNDDLDGIPRELGILPLRNKVAYPYMVLPLAVAAPRVIKLIEESIDGSHLIGLTTGRESTPEAPAPAQIHDVSTVSRIHRAGLPTVILPGRNERDLDELPDEVGREMTSHLVDRVEDAVARSLAPDEARAAGAHQPQTAMG